jgi:hypothetical protein
VRAPIRLYEEADAARSVDEATELTKPTVVI